MVCLKWKAHVIVVLPLASKHISVLLAKQFNLVQYANQLLYKQMLFHYFHSKLHQFTIKLGYIGFEMRDNL